MFDRLRDRVLRLMRVPHEPEPPAGAPGSVRVFRAGRNFYKLKLAGWGIGQLGALVGIVFSLGFLDRVDREVATAKALRRQPAAAQPSPATTSPAPGSGATATPAPITPTADKSGPPPDPAVGAVATPQAPAETVAAAQTEDKKTKAAKARRSRADWKTRSRTGLSQAVQRSPNWLFPVLKLVEYIGILGYLLQIPLTYAMVRLDWEQRWYIVTDRSLRIRTGLTTVLESTMSFANLQQVVVTQGPLQRLLGLADVRVQSAGGGGDMNEAHHGQPSLHTGVFHGVEHAEEIRDLILERLRLFRQAGLGDPDEPSPDAPAATTPGGGIAPPTSGDALTAANELLAEARALRAVVTSR